MAHDENYVHEMQEIHDGSRLFRALDWWLSCGRSDGMESRLYEVRIQKRPDGLFMIAKFHDAAGYHVAFGNAKAPGAVANFLKASLEQHISEREDRFPPVQP